MNIIIPVCGHGKRFQEDGYTIPKPLIKSLGKSIIFWNIENLKTSSEDVIYIVYRKEFDKFNFQDLIKFKFPNKKFEFISTIYDTRGASETVLFALNNMSEKKLQETTVIVDSDNFYNEDILQTCRESNSNLIFYTQEKNPNPIFSYIKLNSENIVTEIKEKEKISDYACVGVYCFENGKKLKKLIESCIINGKKDKNEFYVSSLYNILLEEKSKIFTKEINNFVCLGTPNQLKSFSSNFSISDEKQRFCFDLDNTLVTYPKIKNDYTSVEPITKTINFCNFLKDQGHTIIIYTARRMRTHNGNLGGVIADIGKITLDTLENFNIKYDEIHFGKPYANFYIDDLAVKSFDDLEKETGFYNIHPKTRSHNKIEIHDKYIIKFSESIDGEKFFYKNSPKSISHYFPELIDDGQNYIKISKIEGIPISFLNINKILNQEVLLKILSSLKEIHSSKSCDLNYQIYLNYSSKFENRIKTFDFSQFENSEKIIFDTSNFLKFYEEKKLGVCGVVHGDPVFTNILINNFDELKFIDMRGKLDKIPSIFGDIIYDYSKVYQSIIGYDFILMDKSLDIDYIEKNKKIFKEFILSEFGEGYFEYIQKITISLIISLIPIHNDDKCLKYFNLINLI